MPTYLYCDRHNNLFLEFLQPKVHGCRQMALHGIFEGLFFQIAIRKKHARNERSISIFCTLYRKNMYLVKSNTTFKECSYYIHSWYYSHYMIPLCKLGPIT